MLFPLLHSSLGLYISIQPLFRWWLEQICFHDDVIKWKYFSRYWPFVRGIHRSPVDSPHKAHCGGALVLSLICAWTNGWANNRDAVFETSSLWRHWNIITAQIRELLYIGVIITSGTARDMNKMVDILWTAFWNTISSVKIVVFRFQCYWWWFNIITWLRGFLVWNCSGCPWRRDV